MEREEIINRLLEFDPSDEYHDEDCCDSPAHAYYNAIDRCILLIEGKISNWTDSKVPSRFTHERQ